MEVIDIGNDNLKSSNFGPGIELLMNDKKKESTGKSSEIDVDDLNNLEAELNEFSGLEETLIDSQPIDIEINLNNSPLDKSAIEDLPPPSVHFNETTTSNNSKPLGEATSNDFQDSKTWDGYGKFNNVPVDPDMNAPQSTGPKMSKEEMLREKFNYLKKLEQLERKGVELTKKYSMESSLQEMMGEYEMIIAEKEKDNSVKFQGNMLSAVINGIEFLNNRFDPFDVKLDGWGEQFGENINDYDEIFSELHEKYKSKAKMAPELKLMFQLAGSAMMVHMTNTMFKSAMPNMDDIMRQNPELMQQFTKAATNSMGAANPGFSGFMNGVMNNDTNPVNTGPPPAPMATQGTNSMPPPRRPGFTEASPFARANSPSQGRDERVIELDDNFGSINDPVKHLKKAPSSMANTRNEMKGPSNIDDILSGLKSKSTVVEKEEPKVEEIGSTISISELKEMQNDDSSVSKPKKSKRRQKSDKNTISLDI